MDISFQSFAFKNELVLLYYVDIHVFVSVVRHATGLDDADQTAGLHHIILSSLG